MEFIGGLLALLLIAVSLWWGGHGEEEVTLSAEASVPTASRLSQQEVRQVSQLTWLGTAPHTLQLREPGHVLILEQAAGGLRPLKGTEATPREAGSHLIVAPRTSQLHAIRCPFPFGANNIHHSLTTLWAPPACDVASQAALPSP